MGASGETLDGGQYFDQQVDTVCSLPSAATSLLFHPTTLITAGSSSAASTPFPCLHPPAPCFAPRPLRPLSYFKNLSEHNKDGSSNSTFHPVPCPPFTLLQGADRATLTAAVRRSRRAAGSDLAPCLPFTLPQGSYRAQH